MKKKEDYDFFTILKMGKGGMKKELFHARLSFVNQSCRAARRHQKETKESGEKNGRRAWMRVGDKYCMYMHNISPNCCIALKSMII